MKPNFAIKLLAAVTALMLLGGAAEEPQTQNASGPAWDKPLQQILSASKQERRDGAVAILADRKALIQKLIVIVEPANKQKYPLNSRMVAASLLGELRAEEASDVLTRSVVVQSFGIQYGGMERFESNHADFNSLVNIGRPAVPNLIEALRTSDEVYGTKVVWSVLWHTVGGKAHVLELLDKVIAAEKEPAAKARLLKARERVAATPEDEAPLY